MLLNKITTQGQYRASSRKTHHLIIYTRTVTGLLWESYETHTTDRMLSNNEHDTVTTDIKG